MVTLAVVHETNDLLGSPSTLSANNQRMIHALASDRSPDTRFLATTARGLAPLETIVGAGKAAAIDLPQLASVSLEERLAQVPLEQRLPRLAIFGALTPSMLAEYVCCVRSIRDHHPEATVTLIGYVKGAVDLADCPEISGVSTAPLSPTEYARRARASDYALCIRDGRRYDIRLSASVQDCLSFLVPPIATTNAFIDGLASAAPGPIGFTGLPGSRELTAVVRRVLDDPVSAEHWRHCRALDAVRAAWVPEAAAPRLRRAFESARATGA